MLENFAENIAQFCLTDKNVRDIQVRVEKTRNTVEANGIGVEIYRARSA
jgi:dihydroneopterin aldolase